MHRPTAKLTVLAAALALAGCAATPSESDMAAEASRQFSEMKASIPLETDRATIDYIHCVAVAIVLPSDIEAGALGGQVGKICLLPRRPVRFAPRRRDPAVALTQGSGSWTSSTAPAATR